MQYRKPHLVAEIGCNHKGSIEIAFEMIQMAAVFCKVDYVKFQKRSPRELLSEEQYNSPHPNPIHSYGETYGAHREFLEFDLGQHRALMEVCDKWGVGYSCSVWDMTSAKSILSLQPELIKVPSASNTHLEMLSLLCDDFPGEIHVSLGMTTSEEEAALMTLLRRKERLSSVVLYHSTSGYPVDFEDLNLLEIDRLREEYGDLVKDIGFSGHHLGISADVVAYTLGATYVERHFTLNRTWRGTDNAASLEPDGMRRVARDLLNAQSSLKRKSSDILDIEKPQREKLKWKQ